MDRWHVDPAGARHSRSVVKGLYGTMVKQRGGRIRVTLPRRARAKGVRMMKSSPIDFKPESLINDESRTGQGFGLIDNAFGQARHISDQGEDSVAHTGFTMPSIGTVKALCMLAVSIYRAHI
jgi:hypothetical protein